MTGSNRPLSPHLQVYRLPLTGILSIMHRGTGVLLTIGLCLLAYGLWALAQGEENYSAFQSGVDSVFGRIVLYGWVFGLFFHFCHGVRHLIWDFGSGFLKHHMNFFALLEIILAVILMIAAFVFSIG